MTFTAKDVITSPDFLKVKNLSNNKNGAQADLYSWRGEYYVLRTIGKQYELSNEELVTLERNVNVYYSLLKKHLKLFLPKTFASFFDENKSVIFLITEYFPNQLTEKDILVDEKLGFYKQIVSALIHLTTSKENRDESDNLICSIDTNPENFYFSKENELIFNDFTPPLFRNEDGTWYEYRRKDEAHVLKSEKESRYFNSGNLLLNFINKTRIHLPFSEYINFLEWIYELVILRQSTDYINPFPQVINILRESPTVNNCHSFKSEVELRDLLRFAISLNKNLASSQIKEIYKESKAEDGTQILEERLKRLVF